MSRKKENPDFKVNTETCIRCGLCISDCTVKALTKNPEGYPVMKTGMESVCIGCQHCLAICPEGAAGIHGLRAEDCAPKAALPSPDAMLALLRQRRSVRQYKPESVPQETLEKLKESLRWSPTGCNDHRLAFHLVESAEDMAECRIRIRRILMFLVKTGLMKLAYSGYRRFLDDIRNGTDVIFRGAPHMIVAMTPKNAPCRESDPWIALSYFDLYAQSLGLGTCWCGFAAYAFRFFPSMRKMIPVPAGYRIAGVLLFGTPSVSYPRAVLPEKFGITGGKTY